MIEGGTSVPLRHRGIVLIVIVFVITCPVQDVLFTRKRTGKEKQKVDEKNFRDLHTYQLQHFASGSVGCIGVAFHLEPIFSSQ